MDQKIGDRQPGTRAWSFERLGVWFALVGLCISNGALLYQNSTLKASRYENTVQPISVGERLEFVQGTDLMGNPSSFFAKGRKTVVFFSSPSCPYCIQQRPMWQSLALALYASKQMDQFDIVEVIDERNRAEASVTVANLEISYSRQVLLSRENLMLLRFRSTPTTLVVDENGAISKVWIGAWQTATANEVISFFSLPPETFANAIGDSQNEHAERGCLF